MTGTSRVTITGEDAPGRPGVDHGDAPDSPAAIGRRLKRLRRERALTQRQLAEPVYTSAYVSTLEAGKVRPSEAALRHIAERLGVDYEELATGRPTHIAAALRLRLAEAQRVLAMEDAADAHAAYEQILGQAEEYGLPQERAAALVGLGECALETGELADALARFEAAEHALAGEPLPARARAVRGRSVAHYLAGELRYACYLLESAIDALNTSGLHDPVALLQLYTASIAPYMDMGAHARAAQAAELALALVPQVTDPALVATMHRTVARTLIAEGRVDAAQMSLARATELYQQLQIRTELAHCHWMRGYVCAQHGDLAQAEKELRTAHSMLVSKRAALYVSQVEVELADVLRRRGKPAEAAELLESLLVGLQHGRGALHAGGAHRLLGMIAEEAGDVEAAEQHYATALSLLEQTGAAGDIADICRLFGDLMRSEGRTEEALNAYRTGLGHRAGPGTTTLGPAPARPPFAPWT
ncbi:helix-turn-helix domain-containing protein [Streptomyces sp. ME01-18a]|uniref:tetratricopeptide repeat protein n=1 Tax=unclassified Streptomyces TaxID=2593676 RepID=UPI0029A9CBAD|nr:MULTISPECIES: helix-turn-helix domain-containing protein [unclassified Streptomyces]MDX3432178.1 helix-turn-helix domain-containing protein [Streptomyces sp. ME01-18a]MDX3685398.1 helix-turn-helix domain-containing protein [Streptomyces sp. AK04-4c]WSS72756.1 helix-turn-helix domain-containing protein [Streptomyces sp. NBC_01175]